MKIIGRIIEIIATLWMLTFGLHLFARLLHELHTRLPHWLVWFWSLPLPHQPMDWRSGWPMFVGMAGAFIGTSMVRWGERRAQRRREESEA